jgi:hypothetical protein
MHLGHLFSAFGSERGKEVISILTNIPIRRLYDLDWKKIDLPYSRLVAIAEKLVDDNEKKYYKTLGMIKLAIELVKNNMETHFSNLMSGFRKTHAAIVINTLIHLKVIKGEYIGGILNLQWCYFNLPLNDVLTLRSIRLDWDKRELAVQKGNHRIGLIRKEVRYSMQTYKGYYGFEEFIKRLKNEGIISTKINDRYSLLMCVSFDAVRQFMKWYLKSFSENIPILTGIGENGSMIMENIKDPSSFACDPADILIEKEERKEKKGELADAEKEMRKHLAKIKMTVGSKIYDRLIELAVKDNLNSGEKKVYDNYIDIVKAKIKEFSQQIGDDSIESVSEWNEILYAQ